MEECYRSLFLIYMLRAIAYMQSLRVLIGSKSNPKYYYQVGEVVIMVVLDILPVLYKIEEAQSRTFLSGSLGLESISYRGIV